MMFFLKEKTAYEVVRNLVGSEMFVRDRTRLYVNTVVQTRLYVTL